MRNKLFISKSIDEVQALSTVCNSLGIDLVAHSFLQFKSIPFVVESSTYEVIFFGSPRAVRFFLEQEIIPPNVLTACVGETTAQSLRETGYKVDFVGVNSGNPSKIAEEFKQFVGTKKVLFPQSETSNRTISSIFDSDQISEICIYKTAVVSKSIPDCSIYVFTSPSNVDGFLSDNKISLNAKIIAWGSTTEKHIKSKGLSVNHTLSNATVEELILLLNAIYP